MDRPGTHGPQCGLFLELKIDLDKLSRWRVVSVKTLEHCIDFVGNCIAEWTSISNITILYFLKFD